MEKSLEEKIREQEELLSKTPKTIIKKVVNLHSGISSYVESSEDYNSEYVKLLELKLQLAEEKSKKVKVIDQAMYDNALKNIKEGFDAISNLVGNGLVGHNDEIVNKPKEKTLFDYYEEYTSKKLKDEIRNAKDGSFEMAKVMALSHLSFEESCGLLKYICGEVDKEFHKTNDSWTIGISNEYYAIGVSNWFLFTVSSRHAADKVISICGTEFLDKIFKA